MSFRPILASLAVVATAATVAVSAAPANAEMFAPRTMTVRYADLDLASDAGKSRLDRRIGYAARVVCGADSQELAMGRGVHACRTDAAADAHAQVATMVAFNGAGGGVIQVARR